MPKTMIIRKANDLIEARYKLTLAQQRIILFLTAQIRRGDKDFQEYAITVSDFCKYLELNPKNIYEDFIQISNSLIAKTLLIGKYEKTIVTSWLSSAEYIHDKGIILLQFSPKLRNFLLDLQENFTVYSFGDVKCLKSTYSFRLYELLKQYRKLKERVFYIDELKEMFQIKDAYKNYYDFKKKVILVAQRELAEKADIRFEFEEIKKGRKTNQIRFFIYQNLNRNVPLQVNIEDIPTLEDISVLTGQEKLLDVKSELSFISETLTMQQLNAIYDAAGGDVERIRQRYEIIKVKPKISDFVGYMIKILKLTDEEFSEPVAPNAAQTKPERKNRFVNFNQREIDFDELERRELELLKQAMTD